MPFHNQKRQKKQDVMEIGSPSSEHFPASGPKLRNNVPKSTSLGPEHPGSARPDSGGGGGAGGLLQGGGGLREKGSDFGE